ncbi:hypothetical protein H9P43_001741 [Blastocladiella emersonii ATCC 22665]|nr:hypothetical protein H9P43_001741 [Blastocladiella emersonii ATCC 22665]
MSTAVASAPTEPPPTAPEMPSDPGAALTAERIRELTLQDIERLPLASLDMAQTGAIMERVNELLAMYSSERDAVAEPSSAPANPPLPEASGETAPPAASTTESTAIAPPAVADPVVADPPATEPAPAAPAPSAIAETTTTAEPSRAPTPVQSTAAIPAVPSTAAAVDEDGEADPPTRRPTMSLLQQVMGGSRADVDEDEDDDDLPLDFASLRAAAAPPSLKDDAPAAATELDPDGSVADHVRIYEINARNAKQAESIILPGSVPLDPQGYIDRIVASLPPPSPTLRPRAALFVLTKKLEETTDRIESMDTYWRTYAKWKRRVTRLEADKQRKLGSAATKESSSSSSSGRARSGRSNLLNAGHGASSSPQLAGLGFPSIPGTPALTSSRRGRDRERELLYARSEEDVARMIQQIEDSKDERVHRLATAVPDLLVDLPTRHERAAKLAQNYPPKEVAEVLREEFGDYFLPDIPGAKFIEDPVAYYAEKRLQRAWLPCEERRFFFGFLDHFKDFRKIADDVGTRSIAQCIAFYYVNKHRLQLKKEYKKFRRAKHMGGAATYLPAALARGPNARWSAQETDAIKAAVTELGRDDLPGLAARVKSKTADQCKAWLYNHKEAVNKLIREEDKRRVRRAQKEKVRLAKQREMDAQSAALAAAAAAADAAAAAAASASAFSPMLGSSPALGRLRRGVDGANSYDDLVADSLDSSAAVSRNNSSMTLADADDDGSDPFGNSGGSRKLKRKRELSGLGVDLAAAELEYASARGLRRRVKGQSYAEPEFLEDDPRLTAHARAGVRNLNSPAGPGGDPNQPAQQPTRHPMAASHGLALASSHGTPPRIGPQAAPMPATHGFGGHPDSGRGQGRFGPGAHGGNSPPGQSTSPVQLTMQPLQPETKKQRTGPHKQPIPSGPRPAQPGMQPVATAAATPGAPAQARSAYWRAAEREQFNVLFSQHGENWDAISAGIGTKSAVQVQRFHLKLQKQQATQPRNAGDADKGRSGAKALAQLAPAGGDAGANDASAPNTPSLTNAGARRGRAEVANKDLAGQPGSRNVTFSRDVRSPSPMHARRRTASHPLPRGHAASLQLQLEHKVPPPLQTHLVHSLTITSASNHPHHAQQMQQQQQQQQAHGGQLPSPANHYMPPPHVYHPAVSTGMTTGVPPPPPPPPPQPFPAPTASVSIVSAPAPAPPAAQTLPSPRVGPVSGPPPVAAQPAPSTTAAAAAAPAPPVTAASATPAAPVSAPPAAPATTAPAQPIAPAPVPASSVPMASVSIVQANQVAAAAAVAPGAPPGPGQFAQYPAFPPYGYPPYFYPRDFPAAATYAYRPAAPYTSLQRPMYPVYPAHPHPHPHHQHHHHAHMAAAVQHLPPGAAAALVQADFPTAAYPMVATGIGAPVQQQQQQQQGQQPQQQQVFMQLQPMHPMMMAPGDGTPMSPTSPRMGHPLIPLLPVPVSLPMTSMAAVAADVVQPTSGPGPQQQLAPPSALYAPAIVTTTAVSGPVPAPSAQQDMVAPYQPPASGTSHPSVAPSMPAPSAPLPPPSSLLSTGQPQLQSQQQQPQQPTQPPQRTTPPLPLQAANRTSMSPLTATGGGAGPAAAVVERGPLELPPIAAIDHPLPPLREPSVGPSSYSRRGSLSLSDVPASQGFTLPPIRTTFGAAAEPGPASAGGGASVGPSPFVANDARRASLPPIQQQVPPPQPLPPAQEQQTQQQPQQQPSSS